MLDLKLYLDLVLDLDSRTDLEIRPRPDFVGYVDPGLGLASSASGPVQQEAGVAPSPVSVSAVPEPPEQVAPSDIRSCWARSELYRNDVNVARRLVQAQLCSSRAIASKNGKIMDIDAIMNLPENNPKRK